MDNKPLKILITGGGTGGHLFPGIAIAEAFLKQNQKNNILFIGTDKPFEKKILSKIGFNHKTISAAGIKGKSLWNKLKACFKIPQGIFEAIWLIILFWPDIVIGMGGYSSGPVVIGAWFLRRKIVIHEQNSFPGITNRILNFFAKRVYLSFENTRIKVNPSKILITGNPVRSDFLDSYSLMSSKNQDKAKFTILIIGGSQGAHSINMAIIDSLKYLKSKNYIFIHQTGSSDEKIVTKAYQDNNIDADVKAFFHDMANQYNKADLIICRAGATTIAEITATGKPAIFIPFPFAADNHQVFNADNLVQTNAAEMILEKDLNGEILAKKINFLATHPESLKTMGINAAQLAKKDAANIIVKDCYKLLENNF